MVNIKYHVTVKESSAFRSKMIWIYVTLTPHALCPSPKGHSRIWQPNPTINTLSASLSGLLGKLS